MKQQPLDNSQLRIMAPSIFATEPYQAMSDKYTFVPTFEILEKLRKEGFYPYQARESRTRIMDKRGFTKHMLRLRHANHALCQQVGDLIPEVVLVNSHDGGCAYQMHAGLFRLICSNGMTVADSTFEKLSVRHSGDCWIEAIEGALSIAQAMPQIIEKVKDFQAIELSPDERGVFAEAALQLRYPEKAPITAAQLLRPRRYEDNRKDLFATMNVVQEHLIKGGIRGRSLGRNQRLTTTRTIKGIDQDVKLNKSLWLLTERMAELKTA